MVAISLCRCARPTALTGVVKALALLANRRAHLIQCYRRPVQPVWRSAGMMSAINIVAVLDSLERLGIDAARVLALAGVSLEALRAPNARVPAALEFAFWDALAKHTGDPMIGLRVAEQIQVGSLGAYEYLLRNSPTIRAAIEQANKFERVMDDLTRIAIVETEHAHEAAIRHYREGGVPHATYATECLFAAVLRLVKTLLPGQQVLCVRFAHAPNGEPRDYQARLGCPVSFGAAYNEIVIDKATLDLPQNAADPALSRVLEQHMTHMLQHLPAEESFVQRARTALGDTLRRNGDVSLEQLAQTLHLSERTLRRRLEEHATSYKNLLDELRRELACHYIARTSESFEVTAGRLGFADVSAFYRAFKRWTSTTPAAYRAQVRQRDSAL
jgi:AraC-like DNA-binding protein